MKAYCKSFPLLYMLFLSQSNSIRRYSETPFHSEQSAVPSHDTSGDPCILDFSVSGYMPLAVQLMSSFGDISEDSLRTLNFVQHVTATLNL